MALKYKFVTPVSSLVVVKPNDTSAVDTEEAKQDNIHKGSMFLAGPAAQGGFSYALAPQAPILGIPPPGIGLSAISAHNRHPIVATYNPQVLTTPIYFSTTFVHKSNLESLLDALPWLNDILDNGFVKTPKGNYKLGANETISDTVTCPKTPLNEEGHCSLLHDCAQVHSLLQNSTNLFDHLCILKNEYAGVCCPN